MEGIYAVGLIFTPTTEIRELEQLGPKTYIWDGMGSFRNLLKETKFVELEC